MYYATVLTTPASLFARTLTLYDSDDEICFVIITELISAHGLLIHCIYNNKPNWRPSVWYEVLSDSG